MLIASADTGFVPTYLRVVGPITRQIIVGMALLLLSGIGWPLLGYSFTSRLVVKLVLFAVIWVLGPVIDLVFEARFRRLAPAAAQPASGAFVIARRQYVVIETTATLLFYIIIIVWVLR